MSLGLCLFFAYFLHIRALAASILVICCLLFADFSKKYAKNNQKMGNVGARRGVRDFINKCWIHIEPVFPWMKNAQKSLFLWCKSSSDAPTIFFSIELERKVKDMRHIKTVLKIRPVTAEVRIVNALLQCEIFYIQDLLVKTKRELAKLPDIGRKGIQRIERALWVEKKGYPDFDVGLTSSRQKNTPV